MCSHSRLYHIPFTLYGSQKIKKFFSMYYMEEYITYSEQRRIFLPEFLKVIKVFCIVNCSKRAFKGYVLRMIFSLLRAETRRLNFW